MILEITNGYNQGATFRLGHRTLTIGRDGRNMVQLIDDQVSRRHAMVRWDGSGYILVDLKSHNATILNGKVVTEARLAEGDKLVLGNTELTVTTAWRIVEDAALGQKVVDRRIVAGATRTADLRTGVQDFIAAGATVEVDQFREAQDLLMHTFVFKLGRAIAQGQPGPEVLKQAAGGIREMLSPDRLLFLRVTPEGKAVAIHRATSENVGPDKLKVVPYVPGLVACVKSAQVVLENGLGKRAGGQNPLGSMLAAPVVSDGRAIGVLYIDSFADSPQSFIAEDGDVLVKVAEVLTPVFVR